MQAAEYLAMGAVKARNALTSETNLDTLQGVLDEDQRMLVRDKAAARIRALRAAGVTAPEPLVPPGFVEAPRDLTPPPEEPPIPVHIDLDHIGDVDQLPDDVTTEYGLAPEPTPAAEHDTEAGFDLLGPDEVVDAVRAEPVVEGTIVGVREAAGKVELTVATDIGEVKFSVGPLSAPLPETKKPRKQKAKGTVSVEAATPEAAPKEYMLPEGADAEARHTCTKCGHEGPVLRDFGFRVLKHKRKDGSFAVDASGNVKTSTTSQPQCRKCRAAAARSAAHKANAASAANVVAS